jgi:hypothetical protein
MDRPGRSLPGGQGDKGRELHNVCRTLPTLHPGPRKHKRRAAATDRTGPYPDPLQPVEDQVEADCNRVRVVVAGRQDVLDSKRGKAKRVIPRNGGSRSTWLNIAKMTRCRAVVGARFCDPKHVSF